MDNIVSTKLETGINLHHMHDSKFNSIAIKVFFIRKLDEDTTKASILSKVLQRATNNYPDSSMLKRVFNENYGTIFNFNVVKVGENHLFSLTLLMPDKKILGSDIGSRAYLKNIELLNELLFNPLKIEGKLSKKYIEREKSSLADEIKATYNDKRLWALRRNVEISCENELFSMPSQGRIDDLKNINEVNLTKFYDKMINNSPVEIYIAGDLSSSDLSLLSDKILKQLRPRENFVPEIDNQYKKEEVKVKKEKDEINQSKLVMSLRTGIHPCSKQLAAYILYNAILGGGVFSKLFKIVREKNSLAYYVHSSGDRNKKISFIEAGINSKDYEKTVELITSILDNMKNGEVFENELAQARDSVINSLWSAEDYIGGNINHHIVGVLGGCPISTRELVDRLKEVTVDQIIEVANKIDIDTIYFLSSNERGELIE